MSRSRGVGGSEAPGLYGRVRDGEAQNRLLTRVGSACAVARGVSLPKPVLIGAIGLAVAAVLTHWPRGDHRRGRVLVVTTLCSRSVSADFPSSRTTLLELWLDH